MLHLVLLLILGLASLATGASFPNQAFISPATASRRDVSDCAILPGHAPSRVRGMKSRVKGLTLAAAAKGGAKKKTKKSDVETFKKADFIASIAEKTGLDTADSAAALKAVLEIIPEQMAQDKKIALVGFGTFQAKPRAARTGRNPRTGEPIDIPASKAPSFTASKALKAYVNGLED